MLALSTPIILWMVYEWRQLQKDPDSGVILPVREEDDAAIEFTATVQEWEQIYTVGYNINQ